MTERLRVSAILMAAVLGVSSIGRAEAGELTVVNRGRFPIACLAEGTDGTGRPRIFVAPVNGETRIGIAPSDDDATLEWVQCGGLHLTRFMMRADGPDRRLVLTGLETRSLKVAIYPFLPTDPAQGFAALVEHVVDTYQAKNPQVVLDAVMSDVGIYSFEKLPELLKDDGYQVMELDMLYLGFLARQGLVNAAPPSSEPALSVATAASTYNGTLYGVPSWLCMDFLYTNADALASVRSLDDLVRAMPAAPEDGVALVGDFNGSWRLPSIYINAYVQRYGYDRIADAFTMPADPAAISDLKTLVTYCNTGTSTVNRCTDNTIHNEDNSEPGAAERVFAQNKAVADIGFSERSFFIARAGAPLPTTAIPVPWSKQPQPLLFADSFVTSAANCPAGSTCTADAKAFTDMMTGIEMRNYIVKATDLGGGAWRTLLVANASFYDQPEIMNNRLYQQYSKVFATAQPFPNTFTAAVQTTMKQGVCRGLQSVTTYSCDAGTNVPAVQTRAPSGS